MRAILLGLAMMLSVGCGGKTSDATTTATATSTIGASGGALTSADGKASIMVPPGALTSDTAITVVGVAEPSIPGAAVIGPAYRFGPTDTQLKAPVTIAIPFGSGQVGMELFFASGAATTFTLLSSWHFEGTAIRVTTTSLGTFVVAVPNAVSVSSSSSSSSGGGTHDSTCVVTCEGPTNADGGIGCDCNTTCRGVAYRVDCRCGECTCTQNGIATATATIPVDTCNTLGAEGLRGTYNNVCSYPAASNQAGGGGPTSGDAGGVCP